MFSSRRRLPLSPPFPPRPAAAVFCRACVVAFFMPFTAAMPAHVAATPADRSGAFYYALNSRFCAFSSFDIAPVPFSVFTSFFFLRLKDIDILFFRFTSCFHIRHMSFQARR